MKEELKKRVKMEPIDQSCVYITCSSCLQNKTCSWCASSNKCLKSKSYQVDQCQVVTKRTCHIDTCFRYKDCYVTIFITRVVYMIQTVVGATLSIPACKLHKLQLIVNRILFYTNSKHRIINAEFFFKNLLTIFQPLITI